MGWKVGVGELDFRVCYAQFKTICQNGKKTSADPKKCVSLIGNTHLWPQLQSVIIWALFTEKNYIIFYESSKNQILAEII